MDGELRISGIYLEDTFSFTKKRAGSISTKAIWQKFLMSFNPNLKFQPVITTPKSEGRRRSGDLLRSTHACSRRDHLTAFAMLQRGDDGLGISDSGLTPLRSVGFGQGDLFLAC